MMSKVLVAALSLAGLGNAALVTSPSEAQTRFLFAKHMAQHSLSFQSAEEMEHRYGVFAAHLEHVTKHNEAYERGEHTHFLAMNEFATFEQEEFSRLFKGYRARELKSSHPEFGSVFEHDGSEIPASVDWRTKGVVAPVENQGQCGSCWSFSAAGSITGLNAYVTGSLVQVSEQQFVDCVAGGADTCQVGGEMTQAFEYAISKGGVEPESDYPYCACSNGQCKFDQSDATITVVKGYKSVAEGDEASTLAAVAANPTVSVAVNAAGLNWQLYGGGVMSSSCANGQNNLDHGVLLVGYDSDSAIIKNSWGSGWGESGYIQLKRGINQCGYADDASYPTN